MKTHCLHSKTEIELYLRTQPSLHLYSLGDLDDFFWSHTTWYGLYDQDSLQSVVLVYNGSSLPTVLALCAEHEFLHMQNLLLSIMHLLPRKFYAHLTPGLSDLFGKEYTVSNAKLHYKMSLHDKIKLFITDSNHSGLFVLSPVEMLETLKFYEQSYPGNWFDMRMLETRQYIGLRDNGKLQSIAGIHVFSKRYKVAALGNISTHPSAQRKGFARQSVALLCKNLLDHVDIIGLNVAQENTQAIALYQSLGFSIDAQYEECLIHH